MLIKLQNYIIELPWSLISVLKISTAMHMPLCLFNPQKIYLRLSKD